jgi:very-short-patch-repair endonuclease
MPSRSLSSARSKLLAHRARQMRSEPTISEAKLWQAIAGSRLGAAFRRQAVLGEMIVDFLAPTRHLVVEVDGPYHARRRRADARRDRRLTALGYRVLHLDAALVMHALPAALEKIRQALH